MGAAEVTGAIGAILPDVNLAVGIGDLVDNRHLPIIGQCAGYVNQKPQRGNRGYGKGNTAVFILPDPGCAVCRILTRFGVSNHNLGYWGQ